MADIAVLYVVTWHCTKDLAKNVCLPTAQTALQRWKEVQAMVEGTLMPCVNCGCKMLMGYACREHFVFPSGKGCDWCNGFTEMHSTLEQEKEVWETACKTRRYVKNGRTYTALGHIARMAEAE